MKVERDLVVDSKQFVFPVPLTVPAFALRSVCLWVHVSGRAASVRANGVSGPMTPAFEPPKGTDAPPPGQEGEQP